MRPKTSDRRQFLRNSAALAGLVAGTEGTLKPDQVYALAALLLYRSSIIKEDDVMDAKSVTELQMPYRNAYVPSDLAEIGNLKQRGCRLGHCPGPDPAAH
jgi:hypothetical protein